MDELAIQIYNVIKDYRNDDGIHISKDDIVESFGATRLLNHLVISLYIKYGEEQIDKLRKRVYKAIPQNG